jgi:hypothetical protein
MMEATQSTLPVTIPDRVQAELNDAGDQVRAVNGARRFTLYLAGPMTGLDELNYPAFHEAAARLRAAGFTVVNPAELHEPTWNWADFTACGVRRAANADGVALLDGWEGSKGADLEIRSAVQTNTPTYGLETWLEWADNPRRLVTVGHLGPEWKAAR